MAGFPTDRARYAADARAIAAASVAADAHSARMIACTAVQPIARKIHAKSLATRLTHGAPDLAPAAVHGVALDVDTVALATTLVFLTAKSWQLAVRARHAGRANRPDERTRHA